MMNMQLVAVTAVLVLLILLFTWHSRRRYRRLLATVEIVTIDSVASAHLENERPVYVFLPPGYHQTDRRYKVLYLNDGQDVEQLRLRETLARLYADRRIEPVIVVAIPTTVERLQEYGTAVTANAQGFGAKAHWYSRFVTEEVMPMINQQFRTLTGSDHTAFLGASLGGLSAFDIVWNYPDLFGAAGVFSGSFWWRAGAKDEVVTPNTLVAHEMVRRDHYRPGFRAWFQAATRDETADRDNNGVIDAIQDTLELIDELVALGYRRDVDVVYVEVTGGRHGYETWSQVLPDFLTWALPPGSLPENL